MKYSKCNILFVYFLRKRFRLVNFTQFHIANYLFILNLLTKYMCLICKMGQKEQHREIFGSICSVNVTYTLGIPKQSKCFNPNVCNVSDEKTNKVHFNVYSKALLISPRHMLKSLLQPVKRKCYYFGPKRISNRVVYFRNMKLYIKLN